MVRISVIIPTRNRTADLSRCLEGLAECVQRLPADSNVALHQVVIVDDASDLADPAESVAKIDLPITLLRNTVRRGAGASRHRAAEVADGDVLAFLDDDAVPRGDWLAMAASVGEDQPAITGRVLGFDAGLVSRARQARYDARYRDLSPGTPVKFFGCGNGAVLTEVFHEVGGFSNEGIGGDNSLAVALARRGTPVRFQPDFVIAHRNGKGWVTALHNAWSAGTNHPDRMSLAELRATAVNSAVGDTAIVRELNRALGIVHALGRIMPGPREGTSQPAAGSAADRPVSAERRPATMSSASVSHTSGGGTTTGTEVSESARCTTPAARCRVGVLGLGYAGLPEAIAFADVGHPVVGVDIKHEVLLALRAGRSPLETVSHEQVTRVSSRLTVSDNAQALTGCSTVLVCVPTPLDGDGLPDLGPLRTACEAVAANLRPGQLVVIESTVHPGVTDGVVKPILERSGLTAGRDFSLAFAPERVDPGNPVFDPANTPRVVGGLTPVCGLRAGEIYRGVVPAVHLVNGLRAAEAAKMLENTYRQVNLALVNEFASYCATQGIDVVGVVNAAATKPFGFQAFYPGVGVGGHCIPVDPMYLAYSGREVGVPLTLIELAQRINDERPRKVADECAKRLASAGKDIDEARVLLLGLTYKPNVADVRNTPAVPLIRALSERGAQVMVHDPLLAELVVDGVRHKSVPDLQAAIHDADLVLVAQRHTCYSPELLREASLLHMPGHTPLAAVG